MGGKDPLPATALHNQLLAWLTLLQEGGPSFPLPPECQQGDGREGSWGGRENKHAAKTLKLLVGPPVTQVPGLQTQAERDSGLRHLSSGTSLPSSGL